MEHNNEVFSPDTVFLVTGGAGFIGSHLVEELLQLGHVVRCLDDLSNGKQENVDLFAENPRYTFIRGDITDSDTCLKACQGVDYVLHQAAWGSVPRSIDMPQTYEENNVKGTLNMLDAARRQSVRRVVYASSSSVYGDSPILPKVEGDEGKPLSPYALTKRSNEEWAALYTRLFGLPTFGLRYFNVFGPRQNPNGAYAAVIPRFVTALLREESPVIYGDGGQSRDFTYVANVVDANIKACKAPITAAGRAYNIACGSQVTLLELHGVVSRALGCDYIQPMFHPERIGDVRHSLADISDASRLLNYRPSWSFERGIRAAIDWYWENLK